MFTLAFQLLDDKELEELRGGIASVEEMVLTDEQIAKGMTLYDVEMAIESNPDYYAYFERETEHGIIRVTKFDVERELNKIREWIFLLVRVKSQGRRFRRFR